MTTTDHLGIDMLQNILARLPSVDFASANCVSRLWKHVCGHILCRPKLSSACSFNCSLQVAVEHVVNKVLSEPIRPHFAIASVADIDNTEYDYEEAHQLVCYLDFKTNTIFKLFHEKIAIYLKRMEYFYSSTRFAKFIKFMNELQITTKLGSKVPLITTYAFGIIGRDAISDEFQEVYLTLWTRDISMGGIMLTVGFVPGMKVKLISLLHQLKDPQTFMTDEFIMDIKEFSTSTSGRESPAAIMIFMVRMLLLVVF
ncbi:putative F-box-like domain superfamily protein [Helianthus annuus]|nr:putative F-box-like domain superfamily protein [Helianthus annuus]